MSPMSNVADIIREVYGDELMLHKEEILNELVVDDVINNKDIIIID